MLGFFQKKSQKSPSVEQALILTIQFDNFNEFGSISDRKDITELEKNIENVLPPNAELDGHEFGGGECTIYMYGLSADAIWKSVKPILKECRFEHIDVMLLYGSAGDPQARERSFTLRK